jgi:hypothetical protein
MWPKSYWEELVEWHEGQQRRKSKAMSVHVEDRWKTTNISIRHLHQALVEHT